MMMGEGFSEVEPFESHITLNFRKFDKSDLSRV